MILPLVVAAWLVLTIQIVTLTRRLIAFYSYKDEGNKVTPPVSVIVCAHDEEDNIRAIVPMLLKQDYPTFEVIVVEDRCNDGTYDYLLEATREYPQLKMVRVKFLPEHITGKKYAVTLGVKAASYDWVLLTDADCRPAGDQWIRSMAGKMQDDKQIVLGFSPYLKEPGYLNSFIRFETLVTAVQYIGRAMLGRPYMGTGRNLAYRKTLFLDNKGFHGHLSVTGGDDDLFVNQHATKANTTVSLGLVSLMRSVPKRTWGTFLHQKIRHLSVGKRYRPRDRFNLGVFASTWILSWLLVVPFMLTKDAIPYFLWIGFAVRELLLIFLIHRASRRLGEPFEVWMTPVLDFNYAIYYLGTGLSALLSKRIRWKN